MNHLNDTNISIEKILSTSLNQISSSHWDIKRKKSFGISDFSGLFQYINGETHDNIVEYFYAFKYSVGDNYVPIKYFEFVLNYDQLLCNECSIYFCIDGKSEIYKVDFFHLNNSQQLQVSPFIISREGIIKTFKQSLDGKLIFIINDSFFSAWTLDDKRCKFVVDVKALDCLYAIFNYFIII